MEEIKSKHTLAELRQLQALPLDLKIKKTELRIREWVNHWGVDGVYVSFSGGKDSTVLLDICRRLYPEIVAVYSDTGLEFPEIREFVKTKENVVWVKPELTFRQVIQNAAIRASRKNRRNGFTGSDSARRIPMISRSTSMASGPTVSRPASRSLNDGSTCSTRRLTSALVAAWR